jgi:hypothetical protein
MLKLIVLAFFLISLIKMLELIVLAFFLKFLHIKMLELIVLTIHETEIKMAEMVKMVKMVKIISTWTLPKVEMAKIMSYYIILIRYK